METLAWKPRAVAARTVSDVAAWGEISRTLDVLGTPYRQGDTVNGFYARTGLEEGGEARGGLCECQNPDDFGTADFMCDRCRGESDYRGESATVPHGDRGEHP